MVRKTFNTQNMTIKEVLTSVINLDDHDVMFVAKDGIGTIKAGKWKLRIEAGKPVLYLNGHKQENTVLPAPRNGKFLFVSTLCKENLNRPDFVKSGKTLKGYENAPEGKRPAPLIS